MDEDNRLKSIKDSLLGHDREFQRLLCMIPSKFHLSPPDQSLLDEGFNKKSKKHKNQKITPKQKRLQKRARFDPDTSLTMPQFQGLAESLSARDDDLKSAPITKPSVAPQLSRAELQDKLQRRIAELQNSASAIATTSKADTVSASGSSGSHSPPVPTKDALLELGRQKRGEMRDRRRRERKEGRRREKELKAEQALLAKKRKGLLIKKENRSTGSGNLQKDATQTDESVQDGRLKSGATPKKSKAMVSVTNNAAPLEEPIAKSTSTSQKESISVAAEIKDASGEPDLTFSALQFGSEENLNGRKGPRNPSWTSKKPMEAKLALERRQAYLDQLTPEARERAEESKKWEKAGLQASGTKVMDDPKKLEKALKRQTKEKRKKREAWNERTKAVEKLQEQKQKKRRENIEKRKEQIRDKKKGGIKAKGNSKSASAGKVKKSVKGF
ncbi:surfeit locus protein 6-domain-containing protein [Melampsora americana]|nr:surfeit locus protein 6-domain-containing protein [Melampsora americana]